MFDCLHFFYYLKNRYVSIIITIKKNINGWFYKSYYKKLEIFIKKKTYN